MDSSPTPGPGLRHQSGTRTALRVAGALAVVVGIVLVVKGFMDFSAHFSDPSIGGDDGFGGIGWLAGGGFLVVIGVGLLNAGFLGGQARYAAGETVPVLRDSLDHLGVDRADRARGEGPFCGQCGTRNDASSRFCTRCGSALA